MRIISGKYRGKVLYDFRGKDIRPTSDMAREALFSILQTRVVGCDMLDLFAGSGSVGFEALSRGANSVVMSDKSKQSCDLIKNNAAHLGAEVELYNIPAMYVLNKLIDFKKQFDIIFLDPPYRTTYGVEALEIIAKSGLLKEGGIAILESGDEFNRKEIDVNGLDMYDKRRYGICYFRFFRIGVYDPNRVVEVTEIDPLEVVEKVSTNVANREAARAASKISVKLNKKTKKPRNIMDDFDSNGDYNG